MKKLFNTFIFLFCCSIFAQSYLESDSDKQTTVAAATTSFESKTNNSSKFSDLEESSTPTMTPKRIFTNLENVKDGYYLISGVFTKTNKLDKKLKQLSEDGFTSGYFKNPENEFYYLYINRYTDIDDAIDDYESKFDNKFKDEVWLLQVIDSDPAEDIVENLEESLQTKKNAKKSKGGSKAKYIRRADEYFSRMWYAEASELYEEALQNENNYTFDNIQKAADAHYFNTNMEQAYKWYDILYKDYKDEMSTDNIFKYAHSLKGTGKYSRSKRLMRLYNKKLEEETVSEDVVEKNEMVLDQILSTDNEIVIKNLDVNSEYSDFSPMYYNESDIVFASANDSSFLTTRKYKWDNQPYLDLYVGKLDSTETIIDNAVKMSKDINTRYHEAAVTFSPDQKTMYFTRNNYGKKLKRDNKGVNHLKIYRSEKVNDKWTEATELPFNSDSYSAGHPALSSDGKKLYFVSDMPGSMGDTDIFVVDILEDGEFSKPKSLGPEINTPQKEMFPFVKNDKLYFSSNGHSGLGGLDIYETTLDEEKGYSPAKNLGKPINSSKDDFSYIVNEKTKKGFFASNRDGGKGFDDIYSFKPLIVEEAPENNNAIAGIVVDEITGDAIPDALVELLDENNIKLKEIRTDEDGAFIFDELEGETDYNLKVNKETYFVHEETVTTLENDTVNVNIAMRKLEAMITLENGIRKLKTEIIYFDFDQSYIRNDASKELNKLVEVMTEYPNMIIKIESHTDSRGVAVYNEYLSDKRAKSTEEYIISQGIDPNRIQSAIGYGEQQLLNGCDGSVSCSENDHLLNRRSEFIIVSM